MADLRASGLGGVPKGQTADRPASPSIGDVFYNGTFGNLEIYTSQGWVASSAPPASPISVVATDQPSGRAFNNGQASVAFSGGSGGGFISEFIVTPSPSTSPSTFAGSSSPITVTGLQSSQQYTYTVQAKNNFGISAASSASSAVTAITVPQAPTIGTATLPGVSGQVSVPFTANATGGSAITSYTVTSSPGNITASGASSPITVTGLTNGTAYTFTVTATNTNGTSAASAASNSVTPTAPILVEYLVIAGGGGGGGGDNAWGGGGGGGAGGYRCSVTGENSGGGVSAESVLNVIPSTNYTVTIGGGGAGGSSSTRGTSGTSSVFSTITSIGGGGGGGTAATGQTTGATGGSGGGGGTGSGAAGSGTANQGYAGGAGSGADSGGGGGAGEAGNTDGAPQGGDGISSSITGSAVTRGGGGGGATNVASSPASGGLGGGGAGGAEGARNGVAGTSNTGGGGGGAQNNGTAGVSGSTGGSGVVILRYPSTITISVGAGLTSSTTTVGGNKVTTFTAGTGTISFS